MNNNNFVGLLKNPHRGIELGMTLAQVLKPELTLHRLCAFYFARFQTTKVSIFFEKISK